MKDYSNGKDENFVLNYKEKGDKIIINFANSLFKRLVIDNTEANKNKITDKMRKQILEQDETKMNDLYEKRAVMACCSALFALCCVFPLFFLTDTLTLILFEVLFASSLTLTTTSIIKYIKAEDFLKNKEYIRNEEKINKSIKENKDVLENTNKKVKNIALQNEKPKFDLNSIDKLNYNELKELLENIKRLDEFEFEHIEKDKQLKKHL